MELQRAIEDQYPIKVDKVTPVTKGVGGDTYLVLSERKQYIYKKVHIDSISHPKMEPQLCRHLKDKGVPVPVYQLNRLGESFFKVDNTSYAHLQTLIEGESFKPNTAPEWFLMESARMLGKIHLALKDYEPLPTGIGKDFFTYMTPQTALVSYKNSLKTVDEMLNWEDKGQNSQDELRRVKLDLEYRITLMDRIPKVTFDVSKLTCLNTHGDYTINQIICNNNHINGVVDWTCACVHPVVWELTRSYVYAAKECASGDIDLSSFHQYVSAYEEICPLNAYDKENLMRIYFYQIAVCDYYSQYLSAEDKNRDDFLWQAFFATDMLRFAEEHRL